jgi:hypothetical protein
VSVITHGRYRVNHALAIRDSLLAGGCIDLQAQIAALPGFGPPTATGA